MESNEVLQNGTQSDNSENKRVTVCDIQFRTGTKIYFFDPNGLTVQAGDDVIIETARGAEYGQCVKGNHEVGANEVVSPLRPVIRIATAQDKKVDEENRAKEKRAFDVCVQKIAELGLDMQLVSAEYAFDGSKILFFFTADGRVDFRELVKNLAAVLRTRIELRQIGVRDKAKMVGGLGICGRPFCCREFLPDFMPVSIKMAKTQNLSLNPTKISGTCGRLMCCLKYEQEAYEDLLKTSPKMDSLVDTPDGRGTVTDVNLLRQSVRVRLEQQPDTVVCHKNCDICVLRSGKAKKTDAPIPEDYAPISGETKVKEKKEEPRFTTYLEPVVIRQSAEVLEETQINEPQTEEETSDLRSKRRRRRGGKSHKKPVEAAAAKLQQLAQPVKQEAAPATKEAQAGDGQAKRKNHRHRYYRRSKGGNNGKTEG